jgi:hypothetical protein
MKPRLLKWFPLAAGLTIAAVAVWFFAPAREELDQDFPLKVFFTCDTRGRLEPCGCFTGQHGGLTRLKSYMNAQPAGASLRFDIGDSIGGSADYNLVQYRYMLQAFDQMGFDAINLGHRESQVRASALRDLAASSPVPLISANLLDAESGQPVVAPYRIVHRGAARIAIIGVVEPQGMRDRIGEGLRVEEINTTLAALLPKLRDSADLFVLLAFVDEGVLTSLARDFYEFDLILGGRVRQPAQTLIRENRSAIFFTTNEARTVATMETEVREGRRLQVNAAQVVFLHENIPEDEAFVALSDDYRKEIRQTRLALDDLAGLNLEQVPGVAPIATYVGTESCIGCHLQSHQIWEHTGHAHAFATLQEKGADADPNCIGCHTVGLGTPSGYRREFGDRRLVNVGCESCHGPGSEHVTQRAAQRTSNEAVRFKYRKLTAADCTQCHYGEFSRPFHWDLFWPQVEH